MKFELLRRGVQLAKVRDWGIRGVYILSVSVGLGLIVCVGPSLQLYSLSLLKSPEAGIYASTYGDILIKFPTLSVWLFNSNAILFPVISTPFVFFLTRKVRLPRDAFIAASVYFFVVLCLVDVVMSVISRDSTAPVNIYECLVANLIGSPLIAGCVVIGIRFTDEILGFSRSNLVVLRVTAFLMPLVAGLLLFCLAYYICAIFFNPTASRIEVLVKPSVSGFYAAADTAAGSEKKNESTATASQFGVLTKPTKFDGEFGAIAPQKSFVVEWRRPERPEKYRTSMRFYSGCVDIHAIEKLTSGVPETFKDVGSIDISPDTGPAQIAVVSNSSNSADIDIPNAKGDMFWIDQDSKTKEMTLARFTDGEAPVSYSSSTEKMRMFIVVYLDKIDALNNIHLSDRHMQLKVNGVSYDLSLFRDKNLGLGSRLTCKEIGDVGALSAGLNSIASINNAFGLLVEIEPSSPSETLYSDRKNVVHIKNLAGWVSIAKLSSSGASQLVNSGSVGTMMFKGDVGSFKLNDAKVDATAFDTFAVQGGRVQGTLDTSGDLRLEGTADLLWRDQIRLNPTRWERLDTSVKALLLSAAVTVFSSLFYVVVSTLRRNKRTKSF